MKAHWKTLLAAVALAAFFSLAGCEGDDGADGAVGPPGPPGDPGDPALVPSDLDSKVEMAKVESCATCHGGVGAAHTEIYDSYVDESTLELTIDSVTSVADGLGTYTVTVNFSITDNGLPLLEAPGLASMDQKRFYAVQYDSATGQYLNSKSLHEIKSGSFENVSAGAGDGEYILTKTGLTYAPETPVAPFDGAQVYGYIARGALFEHEGGSGSEIPEGSHVHLYDDVSNTAAFFGTAAAADPNAYQSAANVEGCATCHGTPYLKHGYRNPIVAGLPDFASCKSCHYDDRDGGHEDWQYMVDDPLNWATAGLPDAEVAAKYAYKATLMNDVHMAHGMEFPYPQSMSNCVTCHEGKLDQVVANTNFTVETCKSCHPIEGNDAWPKTFDQDGNEILGGRNGTSSVPEKYNQQRRAPAFAFLWFEKNLGFHEGALEGDCQVCHGAGTAPALEAYHPGYDATIYNAAGERYAELYTASIDSISRDGDLLTINYSANDPDVAPFLAISFFGWDSKHFIVPSHTRDGNRNRFEYSIGQDNPIFSETANSVAGAWEVVVDMAAWVDGPPDSVPNLIADGKVKRAEISVLPSITVGEGDEAMAVGLNAVSETFDLVAEATVPGYFRGDDAVVNVEGCNVCHDQLGWWHGSFGVGAANEGDRLSCNNCHAPNYAGSHVELASRSTDNYVHAIHSFQAFDVEDLFNAAGNDIAAFDPVLAKRYDQHIKHVFPRFTIRNCEGCHVEAGGKTPTGGTYPVVYNVPDQSASMPGLLSRSDNPLTWYTMKDREETGDCVANQDCIPETIAVEDPAGRNISGSIPEYVTGPASRSCGGCHRAMLIKADDAGGLAAFNEHTKSGGTYVVNQYEPGEGEEAVDDAVLFGIIDKIMSLFE